MSEQSKQKARARISPLLVVWLRLLEDYPGWADWRRAKLSRSLRYYDPDFIQLEGLESEFRFSPKLELEHAVIMGHLRMEEGLEALSQCEFYFRRFPFRGLPISRHAHLTNCCEMYFGRFYEIRDRLKAYLNAAKDSAPGKDFDVAPFLKVYDKIFSAEIRARNKIHHGERYSDLLLDHVFLTEAMSKSKELGWDREHRSAYDKASREWARRVRKRARTLESFLEEVASHILQHCQWLTDLAEVDAPEWKERRPQSLRPTIKTT